MLSRQIAERCAEESGAGRLSSRAPEVALIALLTADTDRRKWKASIKSRCKTRDYGSLLLIIFLPIIIHLISTWLARWIFKEPAGSLAFLQMDAAEELGLARSSVARHTCISTPTMTAPVSTEESKGM